MDQQVSVKRTNISMRDLFGHDKAEEAIERVRMFEPPEGYYGATSFGKDSIVVMQLAKEAGVKVDWHYNITTIDPPELIYYGREKYPWVLRERPTTPFLKRLIHMGFPMADRRWCCKEYKEIGGAGRLVITGVRWEESDRRKNRRMVESCYRDGTRKFLNLIIDWTEEDVWTFIRSRGLPYCSLYDEGFKRIGCLFCPKNSRRREHVDRWPIFTKAFKRAFQELYERRAKQGNKCIARWNDGEEMFNWWIEEKHEHRNPDQTVMFE